MKKVVFVLIALIAFNIQAQKQQSRKGSKMTPEQMATMRTKQMTLALDLNESQQNKLLVLNKQNSKGFKALRGEKKELTQEELFELKSQMLDKQIANQREMKNILNQDQYGKWREIQKTRQSKMAKRRGQGSRGDYSKRGEYSKKG
jgi:protein CpxP